MFVDVRYGSDVEYDNDKCLSIDVGYGSGEAISK
jgi:hypothetical protein